MKALGVTMAMMLTTAAGMAAGAYLVMNNQCARKVYRMGKRAAKQMLGT